MLPEPAAQGGLSFVQQSAVTQTEMAQVLMVRSNGQLEVVVPSIDDDGWDARVHIRGEFGPEVTLQGKCSMHLLTHGNRADGLHVYFTMPRPRVLNDRWFWYFLAHFDLERIAFSDPVFLVPASTFHREANPRPHGNDLAFTFKASMSPTSRDKWHRYQIPLRDLAGRVLQILRRPNG